MGSVTVRHDSDAPAGQVWSALADFGNIHLFHPGLSGSHLTGDKAGGVGTTRRCDLNGGGYLLEEVVDWRDGRSYTIEVTESSFPLKSARTTLAVEPAGTGSRISMTIRYKPKFGLLGALMDVLMMRATMRNQMRGMLKGLADFVRAGSTSHATPAPAAAGVR